MRQDMASSGRNDTKRYVSGHRLPVSLPLSRAARTPAALDMPAAFVAQLLTSAPANGRPADRARENHADRAYRGVEASDRKRLPMGYRKAVSA